MRRIKFSFLFVFVIIVAIVGISIVIPEVSFSESYSEVREGQEWTPVITNTPTKTTMATSTATLQQRSLSVVSPTSTTEKNCVYPPEYWEEHPEVWLDLLVGNTLYSKDDIRTIFDLPSPELHQILLQQLYLSNLNIFSGADPKIIQDVLSDANQWLQEFLPDDQMSEEKLFIGVQLAQTLAAFNTGLIGPGYCSPYEALFVTPLVILSPTAISTPSATATVTRVIVTGQPSATATKDKDSDKKPEPTDPPRPTQEPDTPVPPPRPTDPPPPPPTVAPPEPTDAPKPTPTPAS